MKCVYHPDRNATSDVTHVIGLFARFVPPPKKNIEVVCTPCMALKADQDATYEHISAISFISSFQTLPNDQQGVFSESARHELVT